MLDDDDGTLETFFVEELGIPVITPPFCSDEGHPPPPLPHPTPLRFAAEDPFSPLASFPAEVDPLSYPSGQLSTPEDRKLVRDVADMIATRAASIIL